RPAGSPAQIRQTPAASAHPTTSSSSFFARSLQNRHTQPETNSQTAEPSQPAFIVTAPTPARGTPDAERPEDINPPAQLQHRLTCPQLLWRWRLCASSLPAFLHPVPHLG